MTITIIRYYNTINTTLYEGTKLPIELLLLKLKVRILMSRYSAKYHLHSCLQLRQFSKRRKVQTKISFWKQELFRLGHLELVLALAVGVDHSLSCFAVLPIKELKSLCKSVLRTILYTRRRGSPISFSEYGIESKRLKYRRDILVGQILWKI